MIDSMRMNKNMIIENVKIPDTISGLEKLAKDESVLLVYNIFVYMCQCYEQLSEKPNEPIIYDDCWRIRPLHFAIKKQRAESILAALEKGTKCLIRIK